MGILDRMTAICSIPGGGVLLACHGVCPWSAEFGSVSAEFKEITAASLRWQAASDAAILI